MKLLICKLFFIVFLLISQSVFAQAYSVKDLFIDKDWGFRLQTSIIQLVDDSYVIDESKYNLENHSMLFGFSAEVNYYLYDFVGVGGGIGWERLNQPKLDYIPVYANVIFFAFETINTLYAKGSYGYHFGNIDGSGAYSRFGIGYRFRVSKKLNSLVEFTSNFQNIYKNYPDSERISNYYNLQGLGISLAFEIN